jgi:cell division protein FtsA
MGFPIGVKGIVQLVQGPQYATAVGLVRYGASQLSDAAQRTQLPQQMIRAAEEAASPAQNKSGFLNWLRAAF